ncbi:zinc finger protein jing homolog isoform X2 [Ornithodoros turicata]|uniref:zinc finger protein jing homolog isoform X2 n=1 Tax=Ornithodoros turicata TaxID=34597 RepID=UPI003139268F
MPVMDVLFQVQKCYEPLGDADSMVDCVNSRLVFAPSSFYKYVATSSGGSDSCQSSSDSGGVSAPCSPAESELSEPPGTPQPMPPLPHSLLLIDDSSLPSSPPSLPPPPPPPLLQPPSQVTKSLDVTPPIIKLSPPSSPCDVTRSDQPDSETPQDEEDVDAAVAEVLRRCVDAVVLQTDTNACELRLAAPQPVVCERDVASRLSSSSKLVSSRERIVASSSKCVACRWTGCGVPLASEEVLADHVRREHVEPQLECGEKRSFVCRWEGCKVYDRRSSSHQWLERHALLCHGGPRPFACIVDGCGQRFPTQAALQRHVNAHFDPRSPAGRGPGTSGNGPGGSGGSGSVGSVNGTSSAESPLKLPRLKRRLRCRRKGWATAKHNDFFDGCVLEQLRHRLVEMTARQSPLDMHSHPGNSITFHGTVIARRKEDGGKVKVLMHWLPEDVIPDSWLPEGHSAEKTVPVTCLSDDSLRKLNLWPSAPSSSTTPQDRGSTPSASSRRKRK